MKKKLVAFLIDDDPTDQKFFQMAVSRISTVVDCEFADNGSEALYSLHYSESLEPDFIFLDINMPLLDGIECLREMRKMKKLEHLPIYMYSTSADETITENCMTLGATGFIKKVASVNALKEALSEVLFVQKENSFKHTPQFSFIFNLCPSLIIR
jgi:CheY-like chemotaxis protein